MISRRSLLIGFAAIPASARAQAPSGASDIVPEAVHAPASISALVARHRAARTAYDLASNRFEDILLRFPVQWPGVELYSALDISIRWPTEPIVMSTTEDIITRFRPWTDNDLLQPGKRAANAELRDRAIAELRQRQNAYQEHRRLTGIQAADEEAERCSLECDLILDDLLACPPRTLAEASEKAAYLAEVAWLDDPAKARQALESLVVEPAHAS